VTDVAAVADLAQVFNSLPTTNAVSLPSCRFPPTRNSIIIYEVQFLPAAGAPFDIDERSLAKALGITQPPFNALAN
jgi:hypothetical protein